MRMILLTAAFCVLLLSGAQAQFTGPTVSGRAATVDQIARARTGSYVVVTGNVVSHLRGDYFTFRDRTGEIRVEIEPSVWQGRPVSPTTTVRLLAEVDSGRAGRYLWVKSLDIVN